MPGTSITKHNFVKNDAFLTSLVTDLTTAGFTKIFPPGAYDPTVPDSIIIMEATSTVDTLAVADKQPWRIAFKKRSLTAPGSDVIDMLIGTSYTLKNDGTYAKVFKSSSALTDTQPTGLVGRAFTADTITKTDPRHRRLCFWSRADRDAGNESSYPFSYKLTSTPRGVMLHVWEPGTVLGYGDSGPVSTTVVLQRLVDNATGLAQVTGKAPLHCLMSLGNRFERMVICESDVNVPSSIIPAEAVPVLYSIAETGTTTVEGSVSSNAYYSAQKPGTMAAILTPSAYAPIINNGDYIAITEDNNYVTTFPSGFTTSRFAYYGEMDLIAYTSAEIVAQNAIIQFTAYGEATPRKYQAMCATGGGSGNLRVLQLIDGGGTTFGS